MNGSTSNMEGKVAIVTGGARGIGRAIADRCADAGATVYICGRSDTPTDLHSNMHYLQQDVRKSDAVQEMFSEIEKAHGRLDLLVNNAGGSPEVNAEDVSPRFHESIIQLNLLAPLHCAQAAHPLMQGHGGTIVNIASVSAVRSSPWTAAYGAAKAGLINLTESLAMEWGPQIRVNALIVGLVETEASVDHYGGEEGLKRVADMLPLKRMAKPTDIADAVQYLASDQASYVSGAALAVHGGGEVPVFIHLARMDDEDS